MIAVMRRFRYFPSIPPFLPVQTTVCSCPDGTEEGALCAAWYKLSQICLTVKSPASGAGTGLALAGEPPGAATPGCALLPRISYLGQPIPVPQVDECLVVGSNGLSVGAYEFWSSSPISVATLPTQISVTVRSDQDPWVFGMSSSVTDGSGTFGQHGSYQYAVALAMWICAGICVASCCCLCCLPGPCCRPCVRAASRYAQSDVSDAVELACCPCAKTARYVACIGEGTRGEFEDCFRCSTELRFCCSAVGILFLSVAFFVLYETFAGLSLTPQRTAVCASKTLACAGRQPVTVQLSCAPLQDLRSLGGDAGTFWALQVASIAVFNSGLAIMFLLIISAVPAMFLGAMCWAELIFDNLVEVGSSVVSLFGFIGACLQVGTAGFASASLDSISGQYCDSLRTQGINPTSCVTSTNINLFPQLAAVFGMLCVLPFLGLTIAHLFRRTFRLNIGLGAFRAARRRAAAERRLRQEPIPGGDGIAPIPPLHGAAADVDILALAIAGDRQADELTAAERRERVRQAAQNRRAMEAVDAPAVEGANEMQPDGQNIENDENANRVPLRRNNDFAL